MRSIIPTINYLPSSREQVLQIQRERKRLAVERAMRASFFHNKLKHIDLERLDDPSVWEKIPVLDKEQLRKIPEKEFLTKFCISKKSDICEYWRSGGSTGRPLFYPRTYEDIHYALISFGRSYQFAGIEPGQRIHNSFPLGIHPAGQMWARAASEMKIAMTWAGAGSSTPSELQLELIDLLAPDVWMGIPSYGLHLINLAEKQGRSLRTHESAKRKIISSAEPLSELKRKKLEAGWGAKVFNCFGMTESCLLGAESEIQKGFHFWSDLAFPEVLDPSTLEPVSDGEVGMLVVTPLFTNNATPFLRWNSGDLVMYKEATDDDTPFSMFPLLRHAQRTQGFFKVRGININHSDFEEFMNEQSVIREFKLLVCNNGGLDQLKLYLDVDPKHDAKNLSNNLINLIHNKFEAKCEINFLTNGELISEFESVVKPVRFIDERE